MSETKELIPDFDAVYLNKRGPRKVSPRFDLTGKRFGKLLVLREDGRIREGRAWLCVCDCGQETRVPQGSLTRKTTPTQSCGCLLSSTAISERNTKHGLSRHPLYRTWSGILNRCYNQNSDDFQNYGGRGIVVCERWLNSFENFYRDMGEKPTPSHQIDRKNNDGPYSPENCHWVIGKINQQNKRTSLKWHLDGKVYGSLSDARASTGLSVKTVERKARVERCYP